MSHLSPRYFHVGQVMDKLLKRPNGTNVGQVGLGVERALIAIVQTLGICDGTAEL
jgi:hypothetical protein